MLSRSEGFGRNRVDDDFYTSSKAAVRSAVLFAVLPSMLLALCTSFSIIFAEAEPPAAAERVRVPKAVAEHKLFSSSTGSEIPAAQLSLKQRLSEHC